MTNELIKKWEEFSAHPYDDGVGVWTIGYGTTIYPNGKVVQKTDPPITMQEAEEYLEDHLNRFVRPTIRKFVDIPLNRNEKDAIESFIYNLGGDTFRDSTLRRKLNAGDKEGAALQFAEFIFANGRIFRGLVRRRADEMVVFLRPAYKSIREPELAKVEDPWYIKFINFLRGK